MPNGSRYGIAPGCHSNRTRLNLQRWPLPPLRPREVVVAVLAAASGHPHHSVVPDAQEALDAGCQGEQERIGCRCGSTMAPFEC